MNFNLKDKIVLITGSTSGIGKIIAEKFLEEKCHVIITGRKTKNLENKKKNQYVYNVDFENFNSVKTLKKKIKSKFKKIDVMVCNVGSGTGTRDLIIEKKNWNKSFNKNFNTFYNCFNIFFDIPNKKKSSIVVISSIAGLEALNAPIEYSVSKSALISYTKNISKKLSPGMRINLVSPGNILMQGNNWYKKLSKDKKKVLQYINNNVPMKKFGKPEDVANAVLFLSSNFSSFISGSNLIVDGGQTNRLL